MIHMKDIFAWVFELLGSATFWSAVSAMATIVAVVGIFLAARQLRFNAWLKAQEIFTESGFVTARSTIFKLLNDSNAAWGEKELADGMQICRKMDELARLASFFGMTESLGRRRMLNVWDDPIAKAWFLLKPKVQAE